MEQKQEGDAEKFFDKITNVNSFAEEVLNSIPGGLESLFQVPSPESNDVYCMMMLNCNEAFHDYYAEYSTSETLKGVGIAKGSAPVLETEVNIVGDAKKEANHNDDHEEWDDINEKDDESKVINRIQAQDRATEKAINTLNQIFEKLDFGSDDLFDTIIKQYCENKSKEMKRNQPNYYQKGLQYAKDKYPNEEVAYYYEIHYSDVVLLICSILKAFTTLNIRLELGDIKTNLMIIFYGNEKQYNFLADLFDYELQLRPYAIKYDQVRKIILENKGNLKTVFDQAKDQSCDMNNNHNEPEAMSLLENIDVNDTKALQFEELKLDQPNLWPPYVEFEQKKDDKFRLYEKDDQYHECRLDEKPKGKGKNYIEEDNSDHNVSKFRNLDKLRLISLALDKFLRLSYLKKKGILLTILYKRNYESYSPKITFQNLFYTTWNIFNQKAFLSFINLIRNFYGEVTSYYFLWVESYIMWLLFPSAIGVIMGIIYIAKPFNEKPLGKTPITVMDILMISYCVIIGIWATLFMKSWKQKEKLYAYIWGTENFIHNEPDSEDFVPDREIDFVFGKNIPYANPFIANLKKCISYLALLVMIIATCSITFLLLHYKKNYFKEDTPENYWFNMMVSMGFACINAIQIKIFNFIYVYIAEWLNYWENYQKDYQRLNDLAIKLIIFDFMNCYSACFYIGFVKPNINDPCIGTCIQEIECQLYTTLLMNLGLNFVEIGLPFVMYKYREWSYKKKLTEEEKKSWNVVTHSIQHQMLCDENNNMIYEYNELIILFGYLCLFSVTAPFTPLFVLFLVWAEKLMDVFKRFFLERSQNLDQVAGIEIYNQLMKVLLFAGMLSNVGVVLFSKEFKVGNDVFYKIIIFFCVENFIIVVIYLLHWNTLPVWFPYVQDLKELYDKKFFRRKTMNLPHCSAKGFARALKLKPVEEPKKTE